MHGLLKSESHSYADQCPLHLQELQNSILDLNRQLDKAKDRENTLLAVERQHKADDSSDERCRAEG